MSIARIYQAVALTAGDEVTLDALASHHLLRVLRAQRGAMVTVFNGAGGEYAAVIATVGKKAVTLRLTQHVAREAESPLQLCLAQGIARGDKMDYIIQKAVELGVRQIVPLLTQRSTVKLPGERRDKRWQHWQAIVISACEQSGRNQLPMLHPPQTLPEWLQQIPDGQGFILLPGSNKKLRDYPLSAAASVSLLVGPEGGFAEHEVQLASAHHFVPLNLGPRVLRTETAAVAALTALQYQFGDMS